MIDLINNQYSKLLFMVDRDREDLADYVRRARGDRSLQEIEDNSRKSGTGISRGYVSQIENRYIISVTTGKLKALAKGLGVAEDEIFAVARGKSSEKPNSRIEEISLMFTGIDDLPEELQQEVLAGARLLAEGMQRRGRSKQ